MSFTEGFQEGRKGSCYPNPLVVLSTGIMGGVKSKRQMDTTVLTNVVSRSPRENFYPYRDLESLEVQHVNKVYCAKNSPPDIAVTTQLESSAEIASEARQPTSWWDHCFRIGSFPWKIGGFNELCIFLSKYITDLVLALLQNKNEGSNISRQLRKKLAAGNTVGPSPEKR
ncbi:hypothetical protein K438DRAFT_1756585 [Mycena galopus ATCC 62051]|nr:hypothetical protein K438DRAFT_1756585 [Mycena galopus ATCC 62051]